MDLCCSCSVEIIKNWKVPSTLFLGHCFVNWSELKSKKFQVFMEFLHCLFVLLYLYQLLEMFLAIVNQSVFFCLNLQYLSKSISDHKVMYRENVDLDNLSMTGLNRAYTSCVVQLSFVCKNFSKESTLSKRQLITGSNNTGMVDNHGNVGSPTEEALLYCFSFTIFI